MSDDQSTKTLRDLLGDGSRSDGFEAFIQFANTVGSEYPDASPQIRRVARFIELVSIACVEGATEMQNAGVGTVDIVDAMCFGTAIAMASAHHLTALAQQQTIGYCRARQRLP